MKSWITSAGDLGTRLGRVFCLGLAVLWSGPLVAEPFTIPVAVLPSAPVVDGLANEWPDLSQKGQIEVQPALKEDPVAAVGVGDVHLAAGVFGERIYIVARWPDPTEDVTYKQWKWRGGKYKRENDRDDMFAIRFHMAGDYDTCMLSDKNYQVDLWKWSAGRSNPAGVAEDMVHTFSTKFLEDATEYGNPGNMIYIRKRPDQGTPAFENLTPPAKMEGEILPGVVMTGKGDGSLVDVTAKGVWKEGYWTVEFSRKLATGQEDDLRLEPGKRYLGGIAVFNKGYAEHKSVNGDLLFDLRAVPVTP